MVVGEHIVSKRVKSAIGSLSCYSRHRFQTFWNSEQFNAKKLILKFGEVALRKSLSLVLRHRSLRLELRSALLEYGPECEPKCRPCCHCGTGYRRDYPEGPAPSADGTLSILKTVECWLGFAFLIQTFFNIVSFSKLKSKHQSKLSLSSVQTKYRNRFWVRRAAFTRLSIRALFSETRAHTQVNVKMTTFVARFAPGSPFGERRVPLRGPAATPVSGQWRGWALPMMI